MWASEAPCSSISKNQMKSLKPGHHIAIILLFRTHHLWNSTTELILWNSQLLPTEFFLLFLTLIFQFTKSNILILIGYSKTAFVLQIPNYSLRKLKFIAPGFSQQKKSLDYLDNPIFFCLLWKRLSTFLRYNKKTWSIMMKLDQLWCKIEFFTRYF